ncbi:hypothetical protein JX266_014287 [Neoarthrinium moseri]|nr:hypothetical protein JX266_014287 [Neoarthrinium moseri]
MGHQVFQYSWARKFGDLYSVWLGGQLFMIISSPEVAKDLMVTHGSVFSSRKEMFIKGRTILKGRGVTATPYNDTWKKHRRLVTNWLRADETAKYVLAIERESIDMVQCLYEASGNGAKFVNRQPFTGRCSLNVMLHPLTGIVFHFNPYISDAGGSPCEAAYLSSDARVKVSVLCSPTNIGTIKDTYKCLDNVKVEELRLDQKFLNTKRMLELMAFGDRSPPLYMQVIQRILRNMRVEQQQVRGPFNYRKFISLLDDEQFTPEQKRPLQQRLDTLESFMISDQVSRARKKVKIPYSGTSWTPVTSSTPFPVHPAVADAVEACFVSSNGDVQTSMTELFAMDLAAASGLLQAFDSTFFSRLLEKPSVSWGG